MPVESRKSYIIPPVSSISNIYWNISLKVREHGVVSSATFNSHGLSRPNSLRDFFKFGFVAFSIDATVPMYKVLFFPLIVVVTPGFLIWYTGSFLSLSINS